MSIKPECPICLEPDSDLCLPCGEYHWFHRACWRQVSNKRTCPVCRGNLQAIPVAIEDTIPVEQKTQVSTAYSPQQSMGISFNWLPELQRAQQSSPSQSSNLGISIGPVQSYSSGWLHIDLGEEIPEQAVQPSTPSPASTHLLDLITGIGRIYSRNNQFIDETLRFIERKLLNGLEPNVHDSEYVTTVYRSINDSLNSQLESAFTSMSLNPRDSRKRKCPRCQMIKSLREYTSNNTICHACKSIKICMRCDISKQIRAFGPRKRICLRCREDE
jgi:hypothetical protein